MDLSSVTLACAGIIGLAVGLLTGIFGVGGGFLMTPTLMIVLSVPGHIAVGTGLAVILATSSFAMLKRRRSGTIDVKLALVIAIGSTAGILLGSHLLELLKDAAQLVVFGKEQDPVQYVLLATFFMLLIGIAGYLFLDYRQNCYEALPTRVGLLARFKFLPYMHFSSLEKPQLSVAPLVLLGFWVGMLTGLVGVGGGVVLLPALVYLVGQRTGKAVGTSLMLVWISSLVAVIRKGQAGDVNILLFTALLIGGTTGAFFGTKIGVKMSGPKIRLYFAYVVVVAIVMVGYKLYALTF